MTVTKLIEWLQALNVPNAQVVMVDPDHPDTMALVTGALYDAEHLEFQCDSDDEEIDE